MSLIRQTATATTLLLLFACGQDGVDAEELAQSGAKSTVEVGAASAFLLALSQDLEEDGELQPYTPEDCVGRAKSGTTTTYTFDGCEGSYGGVVVDGTVEVQMLLADLPALSYTVSSTDLTINEQPLELSADVTYDARVPSLEAETSTESTWTGAWSVDGSDCLVLDGSWTASTRLADTEVEVVGLTFCDDECLASSGSVTASRDGARRDESVVVSIIFGETVVWSTSGGRSGEVELTCLAE